MLKRRPWIAVASLAEAWASAEGVLPAYKRELGRWEKKGARRGSAEVLALRAAGLDRHADILETLHKMGAVRCGDGRAEVCLDLRALPGFDPAKIEETSAKDAPATAKPANPSRAARGAEISHSRGKSHPLPKRRLRGK